ncbi:MAG: hypothetical protein HIU85_02695 [Proteobacteria bacterium]|nr:hypothetical protein [Pseudomonadota bacterium]
MIRMRAALRILRLPCALLAGAALASAVLASPVPPRSPAARAGPAVVPPQAVDPAKPLPPQDLLLACPTTRDYVGRVVAEVMVDGKGPFRFIIDTGANQSTIAPRLAAALGLTSSAREPIRVAGVTGTAIVPSVRIESLRAGALNITHTRLPVIWSPIMAGADGILGAAGLDHDSLLVDFRRNTVEIRRASGSGLREGYARLRATRLPGGLLSVPGEVGNVRVTAIIDTGSPQTLGNMALFRILYADARSRGKFASASVYGATKQVRLGEVHLTPAIDLGSIRIGKPVLVFGDFPIFDTWGLTRQPAIILGMDVLGTVNAFSIDFRYAELNLAASQVYYAEAHEPFPD